MFRDNPRNHLGIEGDANPLVGGSLANGNVFLGETELALQSSSTASVVATHNYWGRSCVPKTIFEATVGPVKRKPWASGNLKREFNECEEARKYDKRWHDGKLDEFKAMCPKFIESTKKESKCLYYGFSFDGQNAHCREGYADAEGVLQHLDNVSEMLKQALTIADQSCSGAPG